MGYLRGSGDYYAGDYYAGDPGIFSFLGRIAKPVIGAVKGFVTGGPVGAIAGAVSGTISAVSSGIHEETLAADVGGSSGGRNPGNLPMIRPPGGLITQSPLGTPVSPAAIERQLHPFGMRRVHPNKTTYVTRGGGTSRWPRALTVHVRGTEQVPTRRMNVANPRALRRSLRRVAGFAKLTKRVRRAVSMAASAVGIHHRGRKTIRRK